MDIQTTRTPVAADLDAPDHLPIGAPLNDADDADAEALPEDPDIAGDDASEEPS
ncbi:hypothetical protein D3C87_2044150 [compost metagenome]